MFLILVSKKTINKYTNFRHITFREKSYLEFKINNYTFLKIFSIFLNGFVIYASELVYYPNFRKIYQVVFLNAVEYAVCPSATTPGSVPCG